MAKLKAATRNKLPGKDFAGPKRSFPIPDKGHAEAAIRDVPRAERAGSITKAQGAKIDRKAEAKLGRSKDSDGDYDRGRKGARDGMGAGRGGLAVHGSMSGSNMHRDGAMHREKY